MNRTIICVDDEPIILEALRAQLYKYFGKEVNVELVESGKEALALIEELIEAGGEIAIVISDQAMPAMQGDELLLEVHNRSPKTNKILLTGQAENNEILSLVNKTSLYRYISKPWEEADLKVVVAEALNAYDRERQFEESNCQLNFLNTTLEDKVSKSNAQLATKTDELQDIAGELKTAQNKLLESEKLASLGQLMAGIAHEINTPLGAINASIGSLQESFWNCLDSLTAVLSALSQDEKKLFFCLIQRGAKPDVALSTKEARVKRKEVSAVLEKWGVASANHWADRMVDMNIVDNISEYKSIICHDKMEIVLNSAFHLVNQTKTTKNIEIAIKKASKVVYALKSYSRFNHVDEKMEVDLRENINTVLVLYQNQIKQGVEVNRNFGEHAVIVNCYPDELIQVWTNIIHNSIQAMSNSGNLTIDLKQTSLDVTVTIADDGPGIPKEIQSMVFNAFFTTKPRGEGSGLGLDIVRKIIDKHNGAIDFKSNEKGTSFNITIPK